MAEVLARRREQRCGTGFHGSPCALSVEQAEHTEVITFLFHSALEGCGCRELIVGMSEQLPFAAGDGLPGGSAQLAKLAIDEGEVAVGPGDPHQGGAAVGKDAEAILALPERLLGAVVFERELGLQLWCSSASRVRSHRVSTHSLAWTSKACSCAAKNSMTPSRLPVEVLSRGRARQKEIDASSSQRSGSFRSVAREERVSFRDRAARTQRNCDRADWPEAVGACGQGGCQFPPAGAAR